MIKNGCIYLSANFEKDGFSWDSETKRSLTWVLLINKVSKYRILIFNTHLDNRGINARLNSSKLIIKYVKQITHMYCCDALLIGDFNSRPWIPPEENQYSYGEHIIPGCLPTDKIHLLFTEAGFIDSYFATNINEIMSSNTYHDYLGSDFPDVALRIDWQLLYPYANSNNKICSYRLYTNEILSDHYPLVCEYQITLSLEDALYSGNNPVAKMCEYGYALRHIANHIRLNLGDGVWVINQILSNDFYLLIDLISKRNRRVFDIPTYNAVVQNGVVCYYNGTQSRYIVKKPNPLKKNKFYHELEIYKALTCLFPNPVYIGKIENRKVYFEITPPVKYNSNYYIMKACCGTSLDQMIYEDDENSQILLKMLITVFETMLASGFVYCDLSPRNTIVEIKESIIILHLIDFEKSYILKTHLSKEQKRALYRGQAFGEELAVMLSSEVFRLLLKDKCNPDTWSYGTEIVRVPFRPEIDQLLKGRGMTNYTIGEYNHLEIEVWDIINANDNSSYYSCRFPGRMKFKVEHYLSNLGFTEALDYERKITEILIKSKNYMIYHKTVCSLSFLIGLLEEKILTSYLFNNTIKTRATLDYSKFIMATIDQMYLCDSKQDAYRLLEDVDKIIWELYWGDIYD